MLATMYEQHAPHRLQKRQTNIATKHYTNDTGADSLACYLRDIEQFGLLSVQQEQELGARIADGDPLATQTMIESNLRLVIAIARTYLKENISLLDLIQEGNKGLMHAVRKWDYRLGFKFATYATWWIRQSITRHLAETASAIRLPDYVSTKIKKLKKIQVEYYTQHEREATFAELLTLTGCTDPELTELFRFMEPPVSLDEPHDKKWEHDDGLPLIDALEDDSALIDESLLACDTHMDNTAQLTPLLNRLTPREKRVITLRYGLENRENALTLFQISKELKLSRERVRQIEALALAKMRATSSEPVTSEHNAGLQKLLEQQKAIAR